MVLGTEDSRETKEPMNMLNRFLKAMLPVAKLKTSLPKLEQLDMGRKNLNMEAER